LTNLDDPWGGLRASIFDVDGTLVDSERDGHRVAFNRAFEELDLPDQQAMADADLVLDGFGDVGAPAAVLSDPHGLNPPGCLDAATLTTLLTAFRTGAGRSPGITGTGC